MSRPLVNALFVGFALFTLGCSLGTQAAAHLFGYQRALGDPLLMLGAAPIYWPFAIFDWHAQASEDLRPLFGWPMICVYGGAVMGAAMFVRMMIFAGDQGGSDYAAPIRNWIEDAQTDWTTIALAGAAGLAAVLLSWSIAGWIVAGHFDFAERFGEPLIAFGPVRLYWPLEFFVWQKALGKTNPSIFAFANAFILGGVGAGILAAWKLATGAPLLSETPRGRHIVDVLSHSRH